MRPERMKRMPKGRTTIVAGNAMSEIDEVIELRESNKRIERVI